MAFVSLQPYLSCHGMRRKSAPNYEVSVPKLKRIVRPLVSKIHVLNGLNEKYPDIVEFRIPHLNQTSSRSRSPEHEEQFSTKRQRTSNEDADASYAEHLREEADGNKSSHHSQTFVDPPDSKTRLESLKPYLSSQVYEAYREIFQIFQNIIHTTTNAYPCSIPKLSTLSSFKMGKYIALSTKSSFYKSSQASLFDQDALPAILKQSQENLSDNMDHWFELEPRSVTKSYRIYFFFGYLIHLLTFHSNQILFLLIPVLVHWLDEESRQGKEILRIISRTLFSEFWMYDTKYGESIDRTIINTLNGNVENSHNIRTFWLLHEHGYWRRFFGEDQYENHLLNSLPSNNKLSHIPPHILPEVYRLIRQNPQHPRNNLILVIRITNLLSTTRTIFKSCSTSTEICGALAEAYFQLEEFVKSWLCFSVDLPLVFNSLYPGNESIFEATFKLSKYMESKSLRVIDRIQDHESLDEQRLKLEEFLVKNETLYHLLRVLKAYFLDTNEDLELQECSAEEISDLMFDADLITGRSMFNENLNDFLEWLYQSRKKKLFEIGKSCYEKHYGYSRSSKLGLLKEMYN